MSDGDKPAGVGAGKIVLIVLAVLVVLGAVCCGGMWMMGGKYAWQVGAASVQMTTELQQEFGDKAAIGFFPDDDGRMVLAIALDGDLTPERAAQAQDSAWKAYCKAFSEGGLGIETVGVGRSGGGKGGIVGWKDASVSATDVAGRTGCTAPPDAPWLEELRRKAEEDAADGGDK